MKFLKITATAILSFSTGQTFAQFQGEVFKPDTSFKVIAYGVEKTIAFSGGFNTPQFAMADLNNDGRQDLVVFEKGHQHIRTFTSYGTAGAPDYRYRPQYEKNFPAATGYLKLEDYNCDNIPDLFHRGKDGIAIFKGYYNASNELSFSFYKDLRYSQLTANTENFESVGFPTNANWKYSGTGWSRQTSGTNPNCSPQSGVGMARFNSNSLPTGSTALFPSLSGIPTHWAGMQECDSGYTVIMVLPAAQTVFPFISALTRPLLMLCILTV
jgi:hypothetical protein